jgi:four helix bundle protein
MLKKLPSFEDLLVWQKAHEMVLKTYTFSGRFPKEESSGLTQQLRKSATTVASHIAEGYQSPNPGRRMQYLSQAADSLSKYRYFLILGEDLSYGKSDVLYQQAKEVEELLKEYMDQTRNSLSFDFAS